MKPKKQFVSKVRLSCAYDKKGLMVEMQAQAPAFKGILVKIEDGEMALQLEGVYWTDLKGLLRNLQHEVEGVIAEVEAGSRGEFA